MSNDSMAIPDHGTLMTLEDFSACVENGELLDDDGFGMWATDTHLLSRTWVYPSEYQCDDKTHTPPNATHIVWFNR